MQEEGLIQHSTLFLRRIPVQISVCVGPHRMVGNAYCPSRNTGSPSAWTGWAVKEEILCEEEKTENYENKHHKKGLNLNE